MADPPENSGLGHVPKSNSPSMPIPHPAYGQEQHAAYRMPMPNFSLAAQLGARQLAPSSHLLQTGTASSPSPLPQNLSTGSSYDSNYLEDYLRMIESMQGGQGRMPHPHVRALPHSHPHPHHGPSTHIYSRTSYTPHPDSRLMGIPYPHHGHPHTMPGLPAGPPVSSNYHTISTSRTAQADAKKTDYHFPPIQGIDRSRLSAEEVRKTILNVLSHEQFESRDSPTHSPSPDSTRQTITRNVVPDTSTPYHHGTPAASPLPSIGTLPSIGSIMGTRILTRENSRSPIMESQVHSPVLENQKRSPSLEQQVCSPLLDSHVHSPAVESQVQSPLLRQQVESPSLQAQVCVPDSDAQIPSRAVDGTSKFVEEQNPCAGDMEYESDEVVSSDGYVTDDEELEEQDKVRSPYDFGSRKMSGIGTVAECGEHEHDEQSCSTTDTDYLDTKETVKKQNSSSFAAVDSEKDSEHDIDSVKEISRKIAASPISHHKSFGLTTEHDQEKSVSKESDTETDETDIVNKETNVPMPDTKNESKQHLAECGFSKKEEKKSKVGRPPKTDSSGNPNMAKAELKKNKSEGRVQKRKKKTPRRVKQSSGDSDGELEREWEQVVAAETIEVPRGETRRPGLRRSIRKTRSVMHLKPLKKRRVNLVVNVPKGAKKNTCEKCGRKFKSFEALMKHSILHEKEMLFPCEVCGEKFPFLSALTRHSRKHSTEVFKCRICGTDFVSMNEFKMHMELSHSETRPFYCRHPGCPFTASKLSNVEKHALIHCEVKMFECPQCKKTFAQQNGLRSHMRSCLEQRGYLCDICGAKFNHLQSMKSHRRLHTGEKPHKCTDCGASFTDHRNFKRHRRIHENIFPYPCVMCEKKFRHSNSLKGHLKTHGINHFPQGKKCANNSSMSGQAAALSSAELVAGTVLAQLAESLENQKQPNTSYPNVMVGSELGEVKPPIGTPEVLVDQKPPVSMSAVSSMVSSGSYSSDMREDSLEDQKPLLNLYPAGLGNAVGGSHANHSQYPSDLSKQSSGLSTVQGNQNSPQPMYPPGSSMLNIANYTNEGRSHSGAPGPLNFSHFHGHHDAHLRDQYLGLGHSGVSGQSDSICTTTAASHYSATMPSFASGPQPASPLRTMPTLPPSVNDPTHAVYC